MQTYRDILYAMKGLIILMPSKHSIGRDLACLLQKKFNINIIDNFLRKKAKN